MQEHAENKEELQKASDELLAASYKIAEKLYQQKGAEQNAAHDTNADQPNDQNKDNSIDAEINQ